MQQEFSFPISPRPVRPSHPPLRRFMGVDNDIQRLDNTGFTCGHAFIVQLLLTFPLSSEYKIFFFFFFWLCHVACRISVPWPGNEPSPLTMRAQSPNHWTTRELLGQIFWKRHREEHIFPIPSCLNVVLLHTIKTTFPGQQSAVKPFHLYIHRMAKHNERNFKLSLKIWKFWIQQSLSILAKGELPGKEK